MSNIRQIDTMFQFMSGPKTSQQSLHSIETGMENCETFQARVQHIFTEIIRPTFFCFECLVGY